MPRKTYRPEEIIAKSPRGREGNWHQRGAPEATESPELTLSCRSAAGFRSVHAKSLRETMTVELVSRRLAEMLSVVVECRADLAGVVFDLLHLALRGPLEDQLRGEV